MARFTDLNYIKPEKGPILEDVADIFQAVYSVFGTKKGSRLFRPTWGGHLSRYLFEPCDEETARSMFYDITETLQDEPRVKLDKTKSYVSPDPLNKRFIINICLDIPGFSEQERTITLVFNQGEK